MPHRKNHDTILLKGYHKKTNNRIVLQTVIQDGKNTNTRDVFGIASSVILFFCKFFSVSQVYRPFLFFVCMALCFCILRSGKCFLNRVKHRFCINKKTDFFFEEVSFLFFYRLNTAKDEPNCLTHFSEQRKPKKRSKSVASVKRRKK